MDSVQKLRGKALEAGNLESNEQFEIKEDKEEDPHVIIIESQDPEVVYVPYYNSTVVYGTWWYPYYPPVYYYPPPYYRHPVGVGISIGVGIVIGSAIWGGCDWRYGNVNIDVNKYNNININKIGNGNRNWDRNEFNKINDKANKERFGDRNQNIAKDRANQPANRDAGLKDQQRAQAKQNLESQGIDLENSRQDLKGGKGDALRNQFDGKGQNLDRSNNALGGFDSGIRDNKSIERGNYSNSNRTSTRPANSNRSTTTPSRSNHSFQGSGGGRGGFRR
jgi:hypothetical protein